MPQVLKRYDVPEAYILDPSLVLYLPLHQLDGASFASRDAYGHLCSVTDALWTPQGRDFDGVDDYIDCGTGLGTNFGNGVKAISLETWFKLDVIDNDGLFYIGDLNSTQGEFAITLDTNTMRFRMSNMTFNQPYPFSEFTSFHHLVATYDGVFGKAFLDSTRIIDAAFTTGLNLSGLKTIIGAYFSNANTVDGIIGEVRIYNRALTAQEIQHNYLATKWRYQ